MAQPKVLYVGMFLKEFVDQLSEDARSFAVDDPHLAQARKQGIIKVLVGLG